MTVDEMAADLLAAGRGQATGHTDSSTPIPDWSVPYGWTFRTPSWELQGLAR